MFSKKYFFNIPANFDFKNVIHIENCPDLSIIPYRIDIGRCQNKNEALRKAKEKYQSHSFSFCKKCCID